MMVRISMINSFSDSIIHSLYKHLVSIDYVPVSNQVDVKMNKRCPAGNWNLCLARETDVHAITVIQCDGCHTSGINELLGKRGRRKI